MSELPWDPHHAAFVDDAKVRCVLWAELRSSWEQVRPAGDDHRLITPIFRADTEPVLKVAMHLSGTGRPNQQELVQFWHGPVFRRIEEAAWCLVTEGILRPDSRGATQFFLTAYGAKCLDAGDDGGTYFDSEGVAEAFRKAFPQADELDVFCSYLAEAVQALSRGMLLSCAVTVGCAYELALIQLTTAIMNSTRWTWDTGAHGLKLSNNEKWAIATLKDRDQASAGCLFEVVRKAMMADRSWLKPAHGGEWHWFESCYATAFFHVRELRNEAGHPSGARPARDELRGHLVQFTEVYRRVQAIIAAYSGSPG